MFALIATGHPRRERWASIPSASSESFNPRSMDTYFFRWWPTDSLEVPIRPCKMQVDVARIIVWLSVCDKIRWSAQDTVMRNIAAYDVKVTNATQTNQICLSFYPIITNLQRQNSLIKQINFWCNIINFQSLSWWLHYFCLSCATLYYCKANQYTY